MIPLGQESNMIVSFGVIAVVVVVLALVFLGIIRH